MSLALKDIVRSKLSVIRNHTYLNFDWESFRHRSFENSTVYEHTLFKPLNNFDYNEKFIAMEPSRSFCIYSETYDGKTPPRTMLIRFDGLAMEMNKPRTIIREITSVVESKYYTVDDIEDFVYVIDKVRRRLCFHRTEVKDVPIEDVHLAGYGRWKYETNGVLMIGLFQIHPDLVNEKRVYQFPDMPDDEKLVPFIMHSTIHKTEDMYDEGRLKNFLALHKLAPKETLTQKCISYPLN